METKSLEQVIREHPFTEFTQWWKMGDDFMRLISKAIVSEWAKLTNSSETTEQVREYINEYISLVYSRKADPTLLQRFMDPNVTDVFYSGEFDALSYAFYRSAFDAITQNNKENGPATIIAKRDFTIQVGKKFYASIQDNLSLDLPLRLKTQQELNQLKSNIDLIGKFLLEQGYLRDQCEFSFSVDVKYAGKRIFQDPDDFLVKLIQDKTGYAIYIMGYPAILPSAVYLYQMYGEAQHHSSRTIEELFDRIGYKARETDDFDPSGFPSDQVVEMWEINR
jgi:hypothetical protein